MCEIKEFFQYDVFSDGGVCNFKTGEIMDLDENGNYYLRILDGGKFEYVSAARLVYRLFVGELCDNEKIVFKDGNINNNDYLNLDKVLYKENARLNVDKLGMDARIEWTQSECTKDKNYLLTESGQVASIRNGGKILKTHLNPHGYTRVTITEKGKRNKPVQVHQVMINGFYEKPEEGFVIDHISRNRDDPSLNNLRIVTIAENNINRNPTTPHRKRALPIREFSVDGNILVDWASVDEIILHHGWSEEDRTEILTFCNKNKQIRNRLWLNLGTVQNTDLFVPLIRKNGEICEGYRISRNGTIIDKFNKPLTVTKFSEHQRNVSLMVSNKRKTFQVNRLVAFTFLGQSTDPTKIYALHKDGNPDNNRADNIIWGSPLDCAVIYGITKSIHMCDKDSGEIIQTFSSIESAHKYLGKEHDTIMSKACKRNRIVYGYRWKWAED